LTSKPVARPGHDSVDFFGARPVFFEDRPGNASEKLFHRLRQIPRFLSCVGGATLKLMRPP